ncbi:DUF5309 domain-containing protein [Paraburkholderia caribensis]|uniref:DUF5309 domain-containing protein n=1 Tax=Paraburkholderia caribensis TaxID=75105 RepID=UPI00078B769A|nr:DUF5309 domain-containing protein [Paraburkholderia caribensis]AMV42265.1 hypothetical protein ATN79_06180 [Paraburkholderia caribensis]
MAGSFNTYDARGIRESLADVIVNISPIDTPFQSNIGKTTASNTYFEWQSDALTAPNANNAAVEGADAGADTSTPTSRIGSYTQISTKVVQVSGSLESVDKAGRKSELAYQIAKRGSELKRDVEAVLTGNHAATPGSDSTARTTAGFESFMLAANSNRGAGGVAGTFSGGIGASGLPSGYVNAAPTDGTARPITEDMLKDVLSKQWTNGGKSDMVMVGAFNKGAISEFTGIATRFRDVQPGQQAAIIGASDVYVSDFGEVTIVPNRFQRPGVALSVDTQYAAVAYLRNYQMLTLAKTGDSEKRQIVCEYGLKVQNPLAHGIIADLTTSAS